MKNEPKKGQPISGQYMTLTKINQLPNKDIKAKMKL
ncbi:hypothetical protein BXY75_0015 [Ulvibacter antarcticus]|uniref:Uncharacterized protein n=1 Tax=Ulvibacter antarcticus TaxID=442714 RepID=A0A3L9ZBM4_9FLAO|nr:hypothetical protein BXY75_0015 [Ulvibacter antarcticus]